MPAATPSATAPGYQSVFTERIQYVDHLPLYRLERIYERQGVFLPRSTLCD
jgi:transposase